MQLLNLKFLILQIQNSANEYDSLGEPYMKLVDKVNAIINYKKSLKLDSSNMNAMDMIKRLEIK